MDVCIRWSSNFAELRVRAGFHDRSIAKSGAFPSTTLFEHDTCRHSLQPPVCGSHLHSARVTRSRRLG